MITSSQLWNMQGSARSVPPVTIVTNPVRSGMSLSGRKRDFGGNTKPRETIVGVEYVLEKLREVAVLCNF